MKALGIPQPIAWLVINAYHSHVPLPKPTKHRGTVLIYALPGRVASTTFAQFLDGCRKLGITSHPRINDFELGGFIGTAHLLGCESDESGDSFAVLESADELGFVPSAGRLGMFNISEDPFPVTVLPHVTYGPYSLTQTAPSPSAPSPRSAPAVTDDEPDEPSFFEDLADAHRTAKRILKKTNDPVEIALRCFAEIFGPPKKRR